VLTPPSLASPNEIPSTSRSLGIVAVFESPGRAETAVATLQAAGFDPDRLSIIAKDEHSGEHLIGCASTGGPARFWGRSSPTWNRLSQRLRGAAVVFVPFVGHVVMLGSIVDWLSEDRPGHGSAEGATRLWRLLARVGVPPHEGIAIESALRECDALLLATGTASHGQEARELLRAAARRNAE